MNFRLDIPVLQILTFTLIICFLPLTGNCTMEEVVSEKKVELAMRMIGHEILTSLGDCESRIMPIEKVEGRYKIPFEFSFGFDPDDIVTIVGDVMKEAKLTGGYHVEVERCETKEIVHSFMVGQEDNSGMIPCRGRALPVDCYNLLVTLLDGNTLLANQANLNYLPENNLNQSELSTDVLSAGTSDIIPAYLIRIGFIFIPLLFLLAFTVVYIIKRKEKVSDPNLVLIGASQFDKRNMAISYDNNKIELSNKEAELLSVLHNSANVPIEREVILQRVWGDDGDYVGRTLDVFISKLRKKLEADDSVKIVNIRGIGYKLVMDSRS